METKNNNSSPKSFGEDKKQLIEENRAVQAALESKSRLIDNMAYQIRTLSNAIIGFSDLLNAEKLEDGMKDYVSEIHQAGKALSILVNDVLDIAKLDTGKLVVTKTNCSLVEQLSDLYETIGAAARQKGLEFSIIADQAVPTHIFTDGDRLVKCLMNLTTNAIKYTKQGFVRVSVSFVEKNNSMWFKFDVEDSGEGITSTRLPQIFDEVAQMEHANRGVLSDMDMGFSITGSLPITKRLATALGGILEVSSVVGTGTTFSLLLPAEKDCHIEKTLDMLDGRWNNELKTKAESPATTSAKNVKPKSNVGHILLVEDQESNRTVITLLLETLGLKITSVEDGQAAVERASTEAFDLILMDLMLPKMTGYEATRILRGMNIRIPIIALSAGVITEEDSRCITEDFDGLLPKPVDAKKLRQTMQAHLPNFESTNSCMETMAEMDNNEFTIEYTN
jgi:CheY-like chemotaxis protein